MSRPLPHAALCPCVRAELSTGHAVSETRGHPWAGLSPCPPGWPVTSLPVMVTVAPAPPPRARGAVLGCLLSRKRAAAMVSRHPAKRRFPGSPESGQLSLLPHVVRPSSSRGFLLSRDPPARGESFPASCPRHRGPPPPAQARLSLTPESPCPPGPGPLTLPPWCVIWPYSVACGQVSREGSPTTGGLGGLASWTQQRPLRVVSVCACESAAPPFLLPSCAPSVRPSVRPAAAALASGSCWHSWVVSVPGWSRFPWRRRRWAVYRRLCLTLQETAKLPLSPTTGGGFGGPADVS